MGGPGGNRASSWQTPLAVFGARRDCFASIGGVGVDCETTGLKLRGSGCCDS